MKGCRQSYRVTNGGQGGGIPLAHLLRGIFVGRGRV